MHRSIYVQDIVSVHCQLKGQRVRNERSLCFGMRRGRLTLYRIVTSLHNDLQRELFDLSFRKCLKTILFDRGVIVLVWDSPDESVELYKFTVTLTTLV